MDKWSCYVSAVKFTAENMAKISFLVIDFLPGAVKRYKINGHHEYESRILNNMSQKLCGVNN